MISLIAVKFVHGASVHRLSKISYTYRARDRAVADKDVDRLASRGYLVSIVYDKQDVTLSNIK